jgi:protein gp37
MSTRIEWAKETWNPATGCDPVSPGCDHCYARTMAKRLKAMGNPHYQTDGRDAPGFGVQCHPDSLDAPTRWRKPRRIFVCSMSDLMHPRVPDMFVRQVIGTMRACPQHTFMVLTRRPRRLKNFSWSGNCQVGVTVESRDYMWRIEQLSHVDAAFRFVSAEPLLGPLNLTVDLAPGGPVSWVVCGGETGPKARPMDLDWARALRDQCAAAGVPFFFKSTGGKDKSRLLDGRAWDDLPTAGRQTLWGDP